MDFLDLALEAWRKLPVDIIAMGQSELDKSPTFDGLYPVKEVLTEEEAAERDADRREKAARRN